MTIYSRCSGKPCSKQWRHMHSLRQSDGLRQSFWRHLRNKQRCLQVGFLWTCIQSVDPDLLSSWRTRRITTHNGESGSQKLKRHRTPIQRWFHTTSLKRIKTMLKSTAQLETLHFVADYLSESGNWFRLGNVSAASSENEICAADDEEWLQQRPVPRDRRSWNIRTNFRWRHHFQRNKKSCIK